MSRSSQKAQFNKNKSKILLIDDDQRTLDMLARFLAIEGYNVKAVSDSEQAIKIFESGSFDLVVTDLKMPKKDGIEVLKAVKSLRPKVMGIVVTGFASIDTAVAVSYTHLRAHET